MMRFVSFLAPAMTPVYEFIARAVGERLGVPTEFAYAERYEQLAGADVCFLCGLAYIELCDRERAPFVPVAAPILQGERYEGRPIYFSDVIVRRDSRFTTFADLEGASWCYNEPLSHSGYGITRYHLTRLGRTGGYFGRVVEAGYHARSIELVRTGAVDASAIDSHVLELALRDDPTLVDELRILTSLGPSTVQPVVAGMWLSEALRAQIQRALVDLADDAIARGWLGRGRIERFVAVDDRHYGDLRTMRDACAEAGFLTLR
jgi:phosphonate transport system substrate-binding protein